MTDTLYNQAIIDAGKDKAHTGRLENPDATATADNPLCGDRVTLDLEAQGGIITNLTHTTRGCLLTKAAAALLTRHCQGLPLSEARALQKAAKAYLEGETASAPVPDNCTLPCESRSAFSASFSSLTTSSAVTATRAATGFPPKVEPCWPGLMHIMISSFASTAETG